MKKSTSNLPIDPAPKKYVGHIEVDSSPFARFNWVSLTISGITALLAGKKKGEALVIMKEIPAMIPIVSES